MDLAIWQIVLITLYAFLFIIDDLSFNIGLARPIVAGFATGLIMGDPVMGLAVGATLQLMILGVSSYGGASVPDFTTGAIIGTILGIISGKTVDFAIGLAVPVGLLLVQLDVLARFSNTYFLHKADKYAESANIKGVERMVLLGVLPWGLSRALPVLTVLLFGQNVVDTVLAYTPDWLMGGLKVAGGILPVVGIAILLKFLPTPKYVSYLIIGFVLAAYLKVPMIGVALVGLAIGLVIFRQRTENQAALATGGYDYDDE